MRMRMEWHMKKSFTLEIHGKVLILSLSEYPAMAPPVKQNSVIVVTHIVVCRAYATHFLSDVQLPRHAVVREIRAGRRLQ